MEARFTILETLEGFRRWLQSYYVARMGRYARVGASGLDPYAEKPIYILDYHAPVSGAGHVIFRVEESDADWLEVQAATHWALEDRDPERRRRDQEVLDAHFAGLVQAIRAKWGDAGDRYVTFDQIAPRMVVKSFIVTGATKHFANVIAFAASKLKERFADGRYVVRCLEPSCLACVIVRQWPSLVDPERDHEKEIIAFFVSGGGGSLLVRVEYKLHADGDNERAELVLATIVTHYPESEI